MQIQTGLKKGGELYRAYLCALRNSAVYNMARHNGLGRDDVKNLALYHVYKNASTVAPSALARSVVCDVIDDIRQITKCRYNNKLKLVPESQITVNEMHCATNILDYISGGETNATIELIELTDFLESVLNRVTQQYSALKIRAVKLYFVDGLTLKDAGKRLNITESRMCQIVNAFKDDFKREWKSSKRKLDN